MFKYRKQHTPCHKFVARRIFRRQKQYRARRLTERGIIFGQLRMTISALRQFIDLTELRR
jgi:hypothetical protein